MQVSKIGGEMPNKVVPNFKANLWICNSVAEVIGKKGTPTADIFCKAAEQCDAWLKTAKSSINETMQIRKNTAFNPKVAFAKEERRIEYVYPHEESGYPVQYFVKKYEDLEFQVGNRKCGFWFDEKSNESKLLEDFKNMFNYLTGNK